MLLPRLQVHQPVMLLLPAQMPLLLASRHLLLLHSMGCLQPVYTQPQVPSSAERPSSKLHDRTAEHPTSQTLLLLAQSC